MKKLLFALAVLPFLFAPRAVQAQAAEESPPAEAVVTISKFHVPLGEDRGKVMQFIQRMIAPQEKANPNVTAFYVLQHYYGADARDVAFVRVYKSFADVEAPCGAPCDAWMAENMPEEGTPEYDELMDLGETFTKYYAAHSDEIFSAPLGLAKF